MLLNDFVHYSIDFRENQPLWKSRRGGIMRKIKEKVGGIKEVTLEVG